MTNLVEAFERLPGIGPKSAQRLTYYLLHVPQSELDKFALALSDLKKNTKECSQCHNISETNPCDICSDEDRDQNIICVVEQPLDVLALENVGRFKGVYHVLHGAIDPLHNIGPDEIRISSLIRRAGEQESGREKEIILALNPNMEGEATCLFINRQITNLKSQIPNIKVTRLAHGLPMGADIQYADDRTLTHALEDRKDYN